VRWRDEQLADASGARNCARGDRTLHRQTVFALHGAFATTAGQVRAAATEEPAMPPRSNRRWRASGRRRERGCERQTFGELEVAALAEVREHGPVALSLRRVARRMGMSPAGLYRYVDSREDLLTLLITRAYDDLADHLCHAIGLPPGGRRRSAAGARRSGCSAALGDASAEQASAGAPPPLVAGPDADVAERLRAVALAYRAWSVATRTSSG
jgi:AcrR family transcriptional regulator